MLVLSNATQRDQAMLRPKIFPDFEQDQAFIKYGNYKVTGDLSKKGSEMVRVEVRLRRIEK